VIRDGNNYNYDYDNDGGGGDDDYDNNNKCGVEIMKLLIMRFSPSSFFCVFCYIQILSSPLSFRTLLHFRILCRRPSLIPIQNNG
jgi:hypothetical protein